MIDNNLAQLRSATNYPRFRGIVTVAAWVGSFFAIAVLISSVVMLAAKNGGFLFGVLIIGVGVLLVIMVRTMPEGSLMLADIADVQVSGHRPAQDSYLHRISGSLPRDTDDDCVRNQVNSCSTHPQ